MKKIFIIALLICVGLFVYGRTEAGGNQRGLEKGKSLVTDYFGEVAGLQNKQKSDMFHAKHSWRPNTKERLGVSKELRKGLRIENSEKMHDRNVAIRELRKQQRIERWQMWQEVKTGYDGYKDRYRDDLRNARHDHDRQKIKDAKKNLMSLNTQKASLSRIIGAPRLSK